MQAYGIVSCSGSPNVDRNSAEAIASGLIVTGLYISRVANACIKLGFATLVADAYTLNVVVCHSAAVHLDTLGDCHQTHRDLDLLCFTAAFGRPNALSTLQCLPKKQLV